MNSNEFLKALAEIRAQGNKAELVRQIVPIKDWVNMEYYVGKVGLGLYPFWKEKLIEVFQDPEHPVNEVIVTGGLGCRPLTERVATSHGYLSYLELENASDLADMKVYSEEGFNSITAFQRVGKKRVCSFTFSDGTTFRCSSDHKLRKVVNGVLVWVSADKLNISDTVTKFNISNILNSKEVLNKTVGSVYKVIRKKRDCIENGIENEIKNETKNETKNEIKHTQEVSFSITEKFVAQGKKWALSSNYVRGDIFLVPERTFSYIKGFLSLNMVKINKVMAYDVIEYLSSYGFSIMADDYGVICHSDKQAIELGGLFGETITRSFGYKETPNYIDVQIIDIQYSEEECCDISVANSPTYLTCGLISHNTGKSTFGLFCLIRKIYELSCYRNIPALFGLMDITTIAFIYFSVKRFVAEQTGFGNIRKYIDTIPYFKEYFRRDEHIQSELRFPENLMMFYGSQESDSIGMNLIGSILDEANFFNNANASSTDYQDVANMYNTILNRTRSRFKSAQRDDSLCILISSNTTTTSFVESRIKLAKNNPNTKIINARVWDTKPDTKYSKERFWVFIGSDLIDPYIVEDVEDIYQFTDSLGLPRVEGSYEEIINSDFRVKELFVDVPVDFYENYRNDLVKSLQDFSGVSVAPMGRLFSSNKIYNQAVTSNQNLIHPFNKEVITVSTGDNIQIKDYLKRDWFPVRRYKERFVHIDQSVSHDSTGLAISYIDSWVLDKTGSIYVPKVVTELMLKIDPPKHPNKISIAKIRDFIMYLREAYNMNFGFISYDSYACLTGDTEVTMYNGEVKKLENVKIGDYILNNTGKCKILNKFTYNFTPTFTITLNNGVTISGTSNHKLRVFDSWCYDEEYIKRYDEERKWSSVVFRNNYNARPVWVYKDILHILSTDALDYCGTPKSSKIVFNLNDYKVAKKEFRNSETVYDITVERDHHYIANGVYSHNSQESLQVLDSSGIPCGMLSVDRSDQQYLSLVSLLYDGRLQMYDYKPVREELFNLIHFRGKGKVDHPVDGCFTGETRVKLSDGNSISIKSLAELYKKDRSSFNNCEIIAYDEEVKEFVVTRPKKAWCTKEVDLLIKISVVDNSVVADILCTPNHKFMLKNKTWVEAKDLKLGDVLNSMKQGGMRIISVSEIKLLNPVEVYDIEVPRYSNFLLDINIVVHNSKDICDAWCGSVWNAMTRSTEKPFLKQDTPFIIQCNEIEDSTTSIESEFFSKEELYGKY